LLAVPSIPHPLVSGGHLRDWQILNLLNRIGIKPHLLYFGAGETYQLDAGSPVHSLVSHLTFGGHRAECPDRGIAGSLVRKAGYLLDRHPRTFPFSFQYDRMQAGHVIRQTAQKVKADIVILRNMWSHYIRDLSPLGCKVIVNCPDFNTALARQLVRAVSSPLKMPGPACNYVGVWRQERTFLPKCDELWIPTDSEARDMVTFTGNVRHLVLPNLVDVSSLPNLSRRTSGSPNSLLFVANFGYLPNANAAKRLLERIIPRVRQRRPAVELFLVGSGLTSELKFMANALGGVHVTGFVDSLNEYYERSGIVLLPVREGAGMLFKTLEALALGKATVGYKESFRGVPAEDGSAFVSVDSDDEMVESILYLLGNSGAREALGVQARAYAEANLSWECGVKLLASSCLLH